MIGLVLAMVWTRRGQAVTLALLSMFAVAAAVAAPAYMLAVDRAVAAGQVATAVPAERGFVMGGVQNDGDGPTNDAVGFTDIGAVLLDLPGFTYVYSAEYATVGIEPTVKYRSRFVYRQDVCAHLTLVSGRCLIGEGEVVIGEQTARRLSLAAGDPITLSFAQYSSDPRVQQFEAAGAPKPLTVVGTYRAADPGETYWGSHGYFVRDAGDRPGEPVFSDAATMAAMDHGATTLSIDGFAGPSALAVANLGSLREGLANLSLQTFQLGENVSMTSGIPDLLDRIDAGRGAAWLIVPVVAVPLVLLACLSIYLAVAYGIEGRRPELAVVALRGAGRQSRWWLATGESLVAIVVGAVAGCLAGQLLVNAVAAWQFPGVEVAPGLASLQFAPVAAAAAVVAAVLAQRRQLLSPVADLLRAPAVHRGVRAPAVEAAVGLLAVVTGVQLLLSDGALTGVGMFAPAFITLALALLAARIALPAITRYAVGALGRGRLGVALAAFQLSRRPGAARLFTLVIASVAVAGYAACAVDVARQGRTVEAELGTGAPRVVSVEQVSRTQLLAAVRAADPEGNYAMAVATMRGGGPQEPPILALDTPRLSTVAIWPDDAPDAAATARLLHPAAPAPVVVPGQDITIDATARGIPSNKPLKLNVALSSVAGLGETTLQFGTMHDGPYTYQLRADVCREGCRLKGIHLATSDGQTGVAGITGQVTIRGLRIVNPARNALTAVQLGDVSRWRISGATMTPVADGLRVDINAPEGLPGGVWLLPADSPSPLPVATAGGLHTDTLAGFDGRPIAVAGTARLPAVPRLGTSAVLVDLEYADRQSTDTGLAITPQVWLSARAPADVLDRLAARGLTVTEDRTAAQSLRQLDEQGPALALWFYVLAACLATALAAGALVLAAVVDRVRRVEDLSALRTQGLGRGAVSRATLWTYPALVLAAVIAGLAIGSLVWQLTGWALPLAGLNPPPLPMPSWPDPLVMTGVGLVLLVVLAGVAFAAGRRTHTEIR